MGKISVIIPDDLEKKLRELSFKRMKGKRGGLSLIIQEALEQYLKKT